MMHKSWWPGTWGTYAETWREPRPVPADSFERAAEQDERDDPHRRRVIAKLQGYAKLREVLGSPLFFDAVGELLRAEGGVLPICKLGDVPLRFSIWSPQRKVLIDVTPTQLPQDVVQAKDEFASKHGLRWVVVYSRGPIPLEDLRTLLSSPAPR